MRSDMAKCVTERPRRGSSNPSAKARWYGKIVETEDGFDYEGHTRLPSSQRQNRYFPKIGEKDFTDVLGPIRGYLLNSCGRPWDEVYAELSRNLGQGSWPVRHVLTQHIDVADCTFLGRDGNVHVHDKYGEHELKKYTYRRQFYVDPTTRLLRCIEERRGWRWRNYGSTRPRTEERVQIHKTDRWYVRIKGLWFIGSYELDPLLGTAEWPNVVSGGMVKAFRKLKQANKRELRHLNSLSKLDKVNVQLFS